MKNVEEIDCNEILWESVTSQSNNGWGALENECRFAFKTKDSSIVEEDIDATLWEKFPSADRIEVLKVEVNWDDMEDYEEVDEEDKEYAYFSASVVIYNSDI